MNVFNIYYILENKKIEKSKKISNFCFKINNLMNNIHNIQIILID